MMLTLRPSKIAGEKQGSYLNRTPLHPVLIPVSSLLQKSSQMNPAAEAEWQVEAALDDLVTSENKLNGH